MQSHTGPITETGLIELQTRQEVTQLIATFQRVVLWLYYCSLLPEHAEGEAYGENEVAYPASTLLNSYSQRRKDVQMLHSSVSQTDLLLIDGMMSSFGELPLQWEKSGNNCLYPPPSLYALLGIYLVKGPPLEDKHCLMLYLLLDMAAFLSDKQSHLEEKLMKFPAAFKMSHSRVKLTQGFWMLDHRDFEEAILFFTDPVVMPGDILPWQHIRILKSFLYQGEHQKALKYIKICKPSLQTPEEVKLHLTTLLANKLIAEAFQYQRQCCDDRNTEDLLTHFFLGCQQTGNMDALLQLPFSSSEEESLIQFLFNSEETFHKDLLVAHFLQRSQPLEAARVNERIKLPLMEGDSHSKERVLIRSSLVSGFLRTLPAMQSKLATEVGKHHLKMTSIFSNATCPVPLSTKIHRDTVNVITQSSKLYELMTRVKDTWSINKVTDHSPLRSNKPDSLVWRSEGFPFIETPGTQRKPKKVESEVVFATPLAKRKMTEFGDSSKMQVPQKKFKGMDHFTPHSRNDGDRRSCRSISSEVLSLLQTPPVKRIIPPIRVRTLERVSAPITDTPPSILKVRQLIKRSATPPSVSRILNYPDLDKDIVKDNYDDEVEKNLRFDVPVIGRDSPTGSEWSTTPEKTSELELSEAAISSVGSSLKSSLQSRHNTTQSSINSTFGGPSFHNSDEVIDEDEDITINFSVHKRREISFVLDKEVSFIKPQIPKPILSKEVIVEESSQSAKPHLKSLDREKTSKTISFMEEPIDKNIIREGSPKSTSLNQEGKPRTISFMEHVPQSSSSLSLEPKEEMVYFEPVSTVQSSITNATPSSTILKQQNLSKKLTHSPLMPSLEKSTLSSFPLKRDLSPVLIKITSGANLNKEIEESVNSGSTINISPLIPTPRPQITRSPLKEDTTDELLVKNDEDDVSSNELQLSESGNEIEEINDEENLDENNQAELQNTPSPDILDSDIDEGIGDNFAEVIVSTSNETNLKNLPSVKLSPSKPNESLRKTPDNLDVSKSESIKTISPIKDSVINSDLQISNRQSSPKIVLGETISKVKNTVETKSLHMTRATEKQVNISMNKEGSPKILRKEGYKNSKTSPKKEMTKKVEDADESGLEKSIKAVKSLLTEAFETAQSVGTDERKSKRMAKIKSLSSLDDRDLSTEKPKLTRQTRSLRSNRKELKSEEEKLSESGDSSMILRSNSKEQKPSDEANISLNLRNSKVISKGKKTNVKMKDQNESFVSASPTASEASDKVFLSPEKDTSISWTPRLRLRSRADSMSSIESSPANITKELASKSSKVSKIKSSILSTVLDINPQKKTGRKAKKKDNILSQDISVIPEDSILESENTSMKQTTALPFVFSPPSTRSRTRRKKSDSFSEPASFYEAPAIQETSSSKPSHKKTGPIPPWECFLNVISPAQEVAEATTKKTRTSIASSLSSRHGMQLRKGPFKTRKKVKL